jgi:hypothetical protein
MEETVENHNLSQVTDKLYHHERGSYMWTFRREHFSPNFEGPSRQLSKSSAREKNQVQ